MPITLFARTSLAAVLGLLPGLGPLAADSGIQFVVSSSSDFAHPHDLVLDQPGRYLYVADMDHDRVRVLDPKTLRSLGQIGVGDLAAPHDVAIDGLGRLLVADTNNDRILIYRLDGARGEKVGALTEGLNHPEGVAVDANGRVLVTNVGSAELVVFRNGRVSSRGGSSGRGPGQFVRPHDIAVGPGGRVFVADPGNNRLQILGEDFTVLKILGGRDYDFKEPKYLSVDSGGWLYVADQHHNVVKVFDPDFKLVVTITEAAGKGLNLPEGIEVRGDSIWISDTYNNRILRYRWQKP